MGFEIPSIFIDAGGGLVVLDVMHNSDNEFRSVAVHDPFGAGLSGYYRNLENFLDTLHTLIFLGDFNRICDAHVDCVSSSPDRREKPCLRGLLNQFQLANQCRLNLPDVPL